MPFDSRDSLEIDKSHLKNNQLEKSSLNRLNEVPEYGMESREITIEEKIN